MGILSNQSIFRYVIAGAIAIVYVLIFTGSVDWFMGFNQAQKAIFDNAIYPRARSGILIIYLMAIFSIYFIAFSQVAYQVMGGVLLSIATFGVLFAFG